RNTPQLSLRANSIFLSIQPAWSANSLASAGGWHERKTSTYRQDRAGWRHIPSHRPRRLGAQEPDSGRKAGLHPHRSPRPSMEPLRLEASRDGIRHRDHPRRPRRPLRWHSRPICPSFGRDDPEGNGEGRMMDLRSLARALSGDVSGRNCIVIPGPGHSDRDRSLSVTFDSAAPDGFLVHSFAGDDFAACRDHVRQLLGIGAFPRHSGYPQRPSTITHQKEGTQGRVEYAASLWNQATAIAGTL